MAKDGWGNELEVGDHVEAYYLGAAFLCEITNVGPSGSGHADRAVRLTLVRGDDSTKIERDSDAVKKL